MNDKIHHHQISFRAGEARWLQLYNRNNMFHLCIYSFNLVIIVDHRIYTPTCMMIWTFLLPVDYIIQNFVVALSFVWLLVIFHLQEYRNQNFLSFRHKTFENRSLWHKLMPEKQLPVKKHQPRDHALLMPLLLIDNFI